MGGSSKTTQQTSSVTEPWSKTIPGLEGIISKTMPLIDTAGLNSTESSLLDQLSANAGAGNPYAPKINALATDLLGGGVDRTPMVSDAYANLQTQLQPFASGGFVDPEQNPALQKYLSVISDDIQNRVNAQFAGAGRDLSGMNQGAVARGISEGLAPTMLNAYNTERDRQLGAISGLYSGANTTAGLLSNLDQTSLGNRSAGIDASTAALQANDSSLNRQLEIEAQRRNIPMQNLQNVSGILGPIAQLGQQSSQTTTSTQKQPLGQQIIGGLIGGMGLAGQMGGFGSSGWLYGTGGTGLLGNLFKR